MDIVMKLFEIFIYVIIGIVFCIIGYKILEKNKHYNLNEEIDSNNRAAGIMVCGLFISIAIIMSGVL